MWIITLIIGLIVGGGLTFLFVRYLPQEKVRAFNEEIYQKEEALNQQYRESEYKFLEKQQEYQHELELLGGAIQTQEEYLEQIEEVGRKMRHSVDTDIETYRQNCLLKAQSSLEQQLEKVAQKYQEDEATYLQEYLKTVNSYVEEFQLKTKQQNIEYTEQQEKLTQLKWIVDTAVEAAKREEEKKQKLHFYHIQLSDADIEEIARLRSVAPHLRDQEALNKVIWKVYYEKPTSDLIGRVVGNTVKTGIYKITNMENQMCYVGQAVDIASRWRQHIKRGIGAEAPTRNKLYPAMLAIGVENFTFEIIEECERSQLDQKEQYWQQFFHARDFGYSIK